MLRATLLLALVALGCGSVASAEWGPPSPPDEVPGLLGGEPAVVATSAGSPPFVAGSSTTAGTGGAAGVAQGGSMTTGSSPVQSGSAPPIGGAQAAGAAGMPIAGASAGAAGSAGSAGAPTCIALTAERACSNAGWKCGTVYDGCSEQLSCGQCQDGKQCWGGTCRDTCESLGFECGTYPDLALSCGTCASGAPCGVGGKCPSCTEDPSPHAQVCPDERPRLWRDCGSAPSSANGPLGPVCLPSWQGATTEWCCEG